MDIESHEYEEKRDIFDLCTWVNKKLFEMEQAPNFEEIYFERRGKNIKKLIEEATPIAKLGLYYWRPWRYLFVKCLTGNQRYDAEFEIVDPTSTQMLKVEVCVTDTDITVMRRQALSRDGFVHLTGSVRREGRKIISEAEMVDVDEENQKVINLAFERFKRKAEHGYDNDTAILVFLDMQRPLPLEYRQALMIKVKDYIDTNNPSLYGAYFCYSANSGIDGIQKSWPDFR